MPNIAAKRKKMAKEIEVMKKKFLSLDKDTAKETVVFLNDMKKEIRQAIVGAEGFELQHLQGIKSEINQSIQRFDTKMKTMVSTNQSKAWDMGIGLVDNPIGVAEIATGLPLLTDAQLATLQGFSSDLITGVTDEAISKINNRVSLSVVGGNTPFETMKEIDRILGIEKTRGVTNRASRIARTEINRAQSTASQLRMEQAVEQIPGLKKQWLTGINPRPTHAAADGQVVDVDKPFIVGGHEAMAPLDPSLPAEEVVNCNCASIPYLEDIPA